MRSQQEGSNAQILATQASQSETRLTPVLQTAWAQAATPLLDEPPTMPMLPLDDAPPFPPPEDVLPAPVPPGPVVPPLLVLAVVLDGPPPWPPPLLDALVHAAPIAPAAKTRTDANRSPGSR